MTNSKNTFRLDKLIITFSRATEEVIFTDVTYFYGQMGSGKTSIARLIDYCLGGSINLTPALLSEFVTVSLHLHINGKNVEIERPRTSENVIVSWVEQSGNAYSVQTPTSSANGSILPGTNVEVLSDLLYYLADIEAPKVRRSKLKEDSDLQRLSFRDIFWYCYVDQDNIDSSFFHLDEDAHPFKKLKSRDVLRFVLGFHQEQVAELELELQELQIQKIQLGEAAKSLKDALKESNIGSEEEIDQHILSLEESVVRNTRFLQQLRDDASKLPHAADAYKIEAIYLGDEIDALNTAVHDISIKINMDKRHRNEILTLGVKVQRMAGARAVLGGVDFHNCPRCTQTIPVRSENHCPVCDQVEPKEGRYNLDPALLEQDAKARISELDDIIHLQEEQIRLMKFRNEELQSTKSKIDNYISAQSKSYDSAYLSNALKLEKENSQFDEQIVQLKKMQKVSLKVKDLEKRAAAADVRQIGIKNKLKEARIRAESDLTNLELLKEFFKDCLIRCKIPGIDASSIVHIKPRDFLPIVENPRIGDIAVTSFSNLSSGGKKTLFKVCFAIAVHRLSAEIGAFLPGLLIIDSPMKNISERENIDQFENFHKLVYELAASELRGTQIILIDKEYFNPPEGMVLNMSARHMKLDDPVYLPLIPYYKE